MRATPKFYQQPSKINQKIKYNFRNGVYEGGVKDGKRNGFGLTLFDDDYAHSGIWNNDKVQIDGLVFINDVGTLRCDGSLVKDISKECLQQKEMFRSNGAQISIDETYSTIEIRYSNHGIGFIWDFKSLKLIKSGEFNDGQLVGMGTLITKNSDMYQGMFHKGQFEGLGCYYNQVQDSFIKGQFHQGTCTSKKEIGKGMPTQEIKRMKKAWHKEKGDYYDIEIKFKDIILNNNIENANKQQLQQQLSQQQQQQYKLPSDNNPNSSFSDYPLSFSMSFSCQSKSRSFSQSSSQDNNLQKQRNNSIFSESSNINSHQNSFEINSEGTLAKRLEILSNKDKRQINSATKYLIENTKEKQLNLEHPHISYRNTQQYQPLPLNSNYNNNSKVNNQIKSINKLTFQQINENQNPQKFQQSYKEMEPIIQTKLKSVSCYESPSQLFQTQFENNQIFPFIEKEDINTNKEKISFQQQNKIISHQNTSPIIKNNNSFIESNSLQIERGVIKSSFTPLNVSEFLSSLGAKERLNLQQKVNQTQKKIECSSKPRYQECQKQDVNEENKVSQLLKTLAVPIPKKNPQTEEFIRMKEVSKKTQTESSIHQIQRKSISQEINPRQFRMVSVPDTNMSLIDKKNDEYYNSKQLDCQFNLQPDKQYKQSERYDSLSKQKQPQLQYSQKKDKMLLYNQKQYRQQMFSENNNEMLKLNNLTGMSPISQQSTEQQQQQPQQDQSESEKDKLIEVQQIEQKWQELYSHNSDILQSSQYTPTSLTYPKPLKFKKNRIQRNKYNNIADSEIQQSSDTALAKSNIDNQSSQEKIQQINNSQSVLHDEKEQDSQNKIIVRFNFQREITPLSHTYKRHSTPDKSSLRNSLNTNPPCNKVIFSEVLSYDQ